MNTFFETFCRILIALVLAISTALSFVIVLPFFSIDMVQKKLAGYLTIAKGYEKQE